MKKIISGLGIVAAALFLVGCGEIHVENVTASKTNPVAIGESVIVTARCVGDNEFGGGNIKCSSWDDPSYDGGSYIDNGCNVSSAEKSWKVYPTKTAKFSLECSETVTVLGVKSSASGSSSVEIIVAPFSLALTPLSSYLEIGESVTLSATASQAVSNDTVVEFTPSNSSVISYSGEKKCTIKAGSKSCVVGVTAKANGVETVSITAAGVATKNTAQIIVVEPSPSPDPTPTVEPTLPPEEHI